MEQGTVVLGNRYRDLATGIEGMATARIENLGLGWQVELTREVDGRRLETWVAEQLLEPTTAAGPQAVKVVEPEAPPPGA